jgi:hypothetical protein
MEENEVIYEVIKLENGQNHVGIANKKYIEFFNHNISPVFLDYTFVKVQRQSITVHVLGIQDIKSGNFYQLASYVIFRTKENNAGETKDNTSLSMKWFVDHIPAQHNIQMCMTDRGNCYYECTPSFVQHFKKEGETEE